MSLKLFFYFKITLHLFLTSQFSSAQWPAIVSSYYTGVLDSPILKALSAWEKKIKPSVYVNKTGVTQAQ